MELICDEIFFLDEVISLSEGIIDFPVSVMRKFIKQSLIAEK
jgi:hypothetical protein